MTAEVVIMNKLAVALAADSASTLDGTGDFFTSNKLFQLKDAEPVGLMVYGGNEFMGIPWETVVGLYRTASESNCFDRLIDYANDFIQFLHNIPFLSTAEVMASVMWIVDVQLRYFSQEIVRQAKPHDESSTGQGIMTALTALLESHLKEMETYPLVGGITPNLEQAVISHYGAAIHAAVNEQFGELPNSETLHAPCQRLIVGKLLRGRFLSASGIVFTGYGRKDVLPAMAESKIYFNILGELGHTPLDTTAISFQFGAHIRPFAQTEMIDTFMEGIDPALNQRMFQAMKTAFDDLLDNVSQRLFIHEEHKKHELQEISKGLLQTFQDEMKVYGYKGYIKPVLEAITEMGKQDLAKMAETLVSLTAFKSQVSYDSESVGGEIDVAVISKNDGFVWVKRKHYALNPSLTH